MNLPKAIEILTGFASEPNKEVEPDLLDAIKLGIEALKVIRDVRPTGYGAIDEPLPGETKE